MNDFHSYLINKKLSVQQRQQLSIDLYSRYFSINDIVTSSLDSSKIRKNIYINGCYFDITDYDKWKRFLTSSSFVETGDPENNRLAPLCEKKPNSQFIIHVDESTNSSESFYATVSGCRFEVIFKEEHNYISVQDKGLSKCLTGYSLINKDTTNGYTTWNLSCGKGFSAWVNDSNQQYYQYGGKTTGKADTLGSAMTKACEDFPDINNVNEKYKSKHIPKVTVKKTSEDGWVISLASVSLEQTAINTLLLLKSKGIDAEKINVTVNGQKWIRLVISGFDSRISAEKHMHTLPKIDVIRQMWVTKSY